MADKKPKRGTVLHPVSQGRTTRMVQARHRFQQIDVEPLTVVRSAASDETSVLGPSGIQPPHPSGKGLRLFQIPLYEGKVVPKKAALPQKIDIITSALKKQLEKLSSQDLRAVNADEFAKWVVSALPQETLSEWDDLVGPFYSTDSLMKQLKVSRQAISKAKLEHRILATPTGDGTMLYPSFQFEGDDTPTCLPHLKDLMPILRGAGMTPWSIALWLKTRRPELNELAPHEALRRTDEQVESVLDLASDDTRRRTAA